MARIGANLCCLYGEAEEQGKFLSVITDAEWGIKLSKLEVCVCGWKPLHNYVHIILNKSLLTSLYLYFLVQISIQPVFRQRPEMKSSLIPDLVKNRKITPDIILEYCRLAAHSIVWHSSIYFDMKYTAPFVFRLCSGVLHSVFLPELKVIVYFRLQRLWSGPWPCDQPVHYHLIAAPRGWGKWVWLGHKSGRDAASVSCRCFGESPEGYPDVAQHQRAHRKSLRCHIEGLYMGDKLGEGYFYPKENVSLALNLTFKMPFFIQLSPYNYERIEVVLKIIQVADENVTTFSTSQVKEKNKQNHFNNRIVPWLQNALWSNQCLLFCRQQASFSTWSPTSECLLSQTWRTRIFWKTACCHIPCPTVDCPSTCLCRPNISGRLSVSKPVPLSYFHPQFYC